MSMYLPESELLYNQERVWNGWKHFKASHMVLMRELRDKGYPPELINAVDELFDPALDMYMYSAPALWLEERRKTILGKLINLLAR